MGNYIYFALIAGVIAVIFAVFKARKINKYDAGNEKMKEIADAIAEGAKAFLFAEYKILIIFVVILFIVLGVGIDWLTAVCFLAGTVSVSYTHLDVYKRQKKYRFSLQYL